MHWEISTSGIYTIFPLLPQNYPWLPKSHPENSAQKRMQNYQIIMREISTIFNFNELFYIHKGSHKHHIANLLVIFSQICFPVNFYLLAVILFHRSLEENPDRSSPRSVKVIGKLEILPATAAYAQLPVHLGNETPCRAGHTRMFLPTQGWMACCQHGSK